jgi:hypothetical protein
MQSQSCNTVPFRLYELAANKPFDGSAVQVGGVA